MLQTYTVTYNDIEHKVRFLSTDFTDRMTLAKALRKCGILKKGQRVLLRLGELGVNETVMPNAESRPITITKVL